MDLSPLLARTEAVTRRIRVARALRAGATTLALAMSAVALALGATRLGWLAGGDLRVVVVGAVTFAVALTLASTLRRLPALLAADLLDRSHALSGRIASALELAGSETPLAALAVDDALAHASGLSPARAFPIRAPAHTRALVLATASVLVAATLHRPPPIEPRPPAPPRLAPLLVHTDDLALERDALHDLSLAGDASPELQRAIDDTNALLEALEDRAIDRTEALRRLGELTARLDRPRPSALVAREDLLAAIGDRLGTGETTHELASALRESDAAAAERALASLADQLRGHSLTASGRRALREALAEARAAQPEHDAAEDELAEAERAVDDERARPEPEDDRLLREQRTQQLREQHAQRMQAEQELERLERELGEAADQLGESSEGDDDAAQSLDDAAEELNRTARDQASEEQMQELAQQLRQLREMIRRRREQQEGGRGDDGEGGDGSGRGSSGGAAMDRYVLRASGGESGTDGVRLGTHGGGGSGGEGETEGSQGEGGEGETGTPGGTSGSARGEDGEGGEGEGSEGEQQVLVLGDEGGSDAILELPGFGRRGAGDARGGGDGEGAERGGAGSEHDPSSLADPTDRAGDHRTVAVHGDDQGRGPSRSEVIRGGAARGFASRDYERVYADYERHAERAIDEDAIPPGYRFYVRRYFDLIRPRD